MAVKRDLRYRYEASDYVFINALRAALRLAPIPKTEAETPASPQHAELNPRDLFLTPFPLSHALK